MFCSNCGKQINDGAVFCANCGQKVGAQNNIQPNVSNQPVAINQPSTPKKQVQVLDKAKGVLGKIKKFRLPRMNVDYSSKAFKFAMIILLSLELGGFLSLLYASYSDITVKFSLFPDIVQLILTIAFFVVLSGIAFLPLFLKLRNKFCEKRSSISAIFCGTFALIKIVFTILSQDYLIQKWFLQPALITYLVEVLLVLSMVIFLFKNRPKNILIPVSLMLIHWLPAGTYSSFNWIKLSISFVKSDYLLNKATLSETILNWNLEVLSSYYIPILIILFLITRYLFSHKTSRGIVIGITVFVFIMDILDMVLNSSFSISSIFGYVNYIARLLLIILFALSMSKTKTSENESGEKPSFKTVFKRGIITSTISIATAFVLILSGLIVSGTVTASYINKNIEQWTAFAKVGCEADEEQWDDFTNSIGKSNNLVLTDNFVSYDDYKNYELIKKNYSTMEDIAICYNAYVEDTFDEDLINEYKYISIDESWQNDQLLNYYYELYQEMAPEQNKIYITESIDPENGIMTIKIKNDNVLPVSECSAKISFKLYYVILSSYSSDGEYSNDSITITVEDIPAKGEITKVFPFDPDNYYNRYTSYSRVFLFSSSSEIVSIE